MKKNYLLLLMITGFILAACSSSKKSTGVWVNKEKAQGKSYHKLFLIVMTADVEARSVIETDLAAAITSKGYQVVKSIDVLPPVLSDPKMPTKDEVVNKVKETGCDAVFIASLLKKEEDVRYEPGTTAYSIRPYYSYYSGYYSNWYPTVSTKEYYVKDKTYFMQSNLYDAASEEIMLSVQSEIFDPSSLKLFSGNYTYTLFKQLQKENLIKK